MKTRPLFVRILHLIRQPVALLLCFALAFGAVPRAGAEGVPHLLNYQGRIAVDGQNFTGTGHFKFALVDGGADQNRTATATASVSTTNRIAGITITNGGSGYVTPPAVTILGTGSGAVATATVSGGAVTAITVEPAGGGGGGNCYGVYSIQPTVGGFIVPAVTFQGVNTFSFGSPGSGALGGLRGGSTTSRAASGSNGTTANFNPPTP